MVFLKNSFLRRYSNLKLKKFDSAQANTAPSQFFCQTILACLSGAQMASVHEIKNYNKSRDTAPLKDDKRSYKFNWWVIILSMVSYYRTADAW